MNRQRNFGQLIKEMEQARLPDDERPTILGGRFDATQIDAFLDVWRKRWDDMNHRIWEYVSEIEFSNGDCADTTYLQRAEIFGNGGHLSLRRDANRWLWHYIGPTDQPPPARFDQPTHCEDFWKANPDTELRCYADAFLLWGEDEKARGLWWEDRVAAARLTYPAQPGGRVLLDVWQFSEDGQVVFVWYRGLRKAQTATTKERETNGRTE